MRTKLSSIIVLLLVIASLGFVTLTFITFTPTTQVEMLNTAMQSVVEVVCESMPDYPATGFYIGGGIVITAGHVADVKNIVVVRFEDGTECAIKKRIVHPDFDCGFLLIDSIDKPALVFDVESLTRGIRVFNIGHPRCRAFNRSVRFLITTGIVCGFDRWDCFGDVVLFVTDANTHSGNSGSPVIDIDGEVIGLHVGGGRSTCGASLNGFGVNIQVDDILIALKAAGLERPILERE